MTGDTGKQQLQEQGGQDWYEIEVEGYINPKWFDWLDGRSPFTGWEYASLWADYR
jgi:hypothetical protein